MTKDTDNNVALYDVLKARKVEDLGLMDFEQEVKKRFQVFRTLIQHSFNEFIHGSYDFRWFVFLPGLAWT